MDLVAASEGWASVTTASSTGFATGFSACFGDSCGSTCGFNATISLCAWSTLITSAVVIISLRGASTTSTVTCFASLATGLLVVWWALSNTLWSRLRFGRFGRCWLLRSRRGTASSACTSVCAWFCVWFCSCGCWRFCWRLSSRCSWRDSWTTSSWTWAGCCSWFGSRCCGCSRSVRSRWSLCLRFLLLFGRLFFSSRSVVLSRASCLATGVWDIYALLPDAATVTVSVTLATLTWPNWPRLTAPPFTICSIADAAFWAERDWSTVWACFCTNRFSNHAHGLAALGATAACAAGAGVWAVALRLFCSDWTGAAAWLWSASSRCHSDDS